MSKEIQTMVKGDKCWIIENGHAIVAVEIISISGNLVLIRTEHGKTLRLPKHRIINSKEEAEKYIKPAKIRKNTI